MARTGNDLLTHLPRSPLRYRHVPMWLVWTVVVVHLVGIEWMARHTTGRGLLQAMAEPEFNQSLMPCKDTHRNDGATGSLGTDMLDHINCRAGCSGTHRVSRSDVAIAPAPDPACRIAPHTHNQAQTDSAALTQPTQMARPTRRRQPTPLIEQCLLSPKQEGWPIGLTSSPHPLPRPCRKWLGVTAPHRIPQLPPHR
jgi:hypothetical protein